MGDLIRIGIVRAVDPDGVRARVEFDELGSDEAGALQSDWLPIAQQGSTADQAYWLPIVGAQVVCVMRDAGAGDGVVIGTIYSSRDPASAPGAGRWYRRFADGTAIEYDPAAGVSISSPLPVRIEASAVEISAASIELN